MKRVLAPGRGHADGRIELDRFWTDVVFPDDAAIAGVERHDKSASVAALVLFARGGGMLVRSAGEDHGLAGNDRRGHQQISPMGSGKIRAFRINAPPLVPGESVQAIGDSKHITKIDSIVCDQRGTVDSTPRNQSTAAVWALGGTSSLISEFEDPADLSVGLELVELGVGRGAEVDMAVDHRRSGVDGAHRS